DTVRSYFPLYLRERSNWCIIDPNRKIPHLSLFAARRHFSRAQALFESLKRRKRHAHAPRDATHFYMKKETTILNDLIETLKDGQEGFRQAAEAVSNSQLKSVFRDYSQQRSRFATALQSEAQRHGETDPE